MPDPKSQMVLGFDFGTKRIGIAVGQILLKTASPLKSIQAKEGVPNWEEIKKIIEEWEASALIVGIPLNMDGTEQAITFKARGFAQQLQQLFSLPVFEIDERLTTKEARLQIFESGGYKALKKTHIDSYAAKLILEHWMQNYVGE